MADAAIARPSGSATSGFGSAGKHSRTGSRGDTPSSRSSTVKNDVKRWKRMHEQNAMLKLTELRSVKKVEVKTSKETARKIARKIPTELLARDWLNESDASLEVRAYMVDKVMPTLILGVEKLLNAVDEKKLANPEAGGGYDPNFNPLNFLAQYLMRNNPRYSNFSEASPYVRGLRQIAEELRAQLFDMEDNRLARIKAEAKRKRGERELQAKLKQQEKDRRQQALMSQFAEWNVPTDNNRVELSLLQNALRSFMEVAEQFPPEIQEVAKFGHPLESTDETGRTLAVNEFAQYLSLYVETLPSEVFEQFMVHMSKCANAHRASAERENRRILLTNLFIYCDHSGIGLLDRHRILSLFEQFWDVFEDSKNRFRNPRRWPVVEVDEADDSLSDDEGDVPTIPETAREYEEEQQAAQEKCEPQTKADTEAQGGEESKGEGERDAPRDETDQGRAADEAGPAVEESQQVLEVDNKEKEDLATTQVAAADVEAGVNDGKADGGKGDNEKSFTGEQSTDNQAAEQEEQENAAAEEKGKADENSSQKEKGEEKEIAKDEPVTQEKDEVEQTSQSAAEVFSVSQEEEQSPSAVLDTPANPLVVISEEEEQEEEEETKENKSQAPEESSKEEQSSEKEPEKTNPKEEAAAVSEKEEQQESEVVSKDSAAEKSNVIQETIQEEEEEEGEESKPVEQEAQEQQQKEETPVESKEQTESKDDQKIVQMATTQQSEGGAEEKEAAEVDRPTAKDEISPEVSASVGDSSAAEKEDDTEQKQEEAEKPEAQPASEDADKPTEPAMEEQKEGEAEGQKAEEEEEKREDADTVIQMEEETPADEGQEVTEKEKESQGQEEKDKDETSADPDLLRDEDISGEIAKSGLQPRVPQPTPVATGRVSITFAQGTAFEREKSVLTANSGNRSQSQMSAFDESNLNVSQFVQLTETFLGEHPDEPGFGKLLAFLREGYEETEDEKMERLMKARKEAISANRRVQLDTLFEKWDNDGSGYLDIDEVEEIMMKFKEGQEKEVISKAREELKKQSRYHDSRLSKKEFRTFVTLVIDNLPGTDGFEYFVEFLANNVERSYAERVRGEARKKWLQNIINSAQTSGISLDPIYKTVFQALYRDAEAHGGEKRVSANVALLEKNVKVPHRGDVLLRYMACTPEDAEYVLNRPLYKDMKGISFAAVEQGKPIHVPRVNSHGNIHFWNVDRMPDEREGSFIVVPLKDRKRRVFGVLGIDTLADPHPRAIFITHEIQYFQGVAQTFSTAYHLVDMRRKLLRITESAISWIKRRSPHVAEIMVYMVEPGKMEDFVLRRMMTTDNRGFPIQTRDPPVRLERKDNLFRDYLFKSVDNSETVTADAYGNRHMAFPLRNDEGKAIAVVDISTGQLKRLPPHENKEMQRMLRLLQQAHKEITREFAGEDKLQVLDAEKDDETRMDIMFDRLMLMELRENVSKLDAKAYAELKAYNSPPQIVLHILRATLAIFYADLAAEGEFNDWNKVKGYINNDLSSKIQAYDPTLTDELISPSIIEEYLKEVPHGEVTKHGSLPAQHLYNWVFVCLSLIEHTRKMRQNQEEEGVGATSTDDKNQLSAEGPKRSVCNPYGCSISVPEYFYQRAKPSFV